MITSTKGFLIILSIVTVCSLGSFVRAGDADYKVAAPDEIPDVLSMLAAATEANYEKIKTWQGRIINETISTIRGERVVETLKIFTDAEPNNLPSEIQRISNIAVEFKINMENDRFFSFIDDAEPYTYLNPKKNLAYTTRLGPGSGPEELVQIVTPEHQTEITPGSRRKKDNAITSRIAIKESPYKPIHRTDPRKVFYWGNKTLWLTLSLFSQNLKTSDLEKGYFVIKKKFASDCTIYRIEVSRPELNQPSTIMILSSEAGLNRTYIENRYDDGSLMSRTTTEFINIDGVFVPKKWEFSHYYKDGGLMRQESCTIEHQQINEPVPDSVFSEYSYLKDGDSFRDRIKGKDFECKNGKLVELSK